MYVESQEGDEMNRRIYRLSDREIQKTKTVEQIAAAYNQTREYWTARGLSGSRLGLKMRDAKLSNMKYDPEYLRGIGQGRLDRATGMDYSEERNDSAYNLGYYRGYSNYQSDLRGGLVVKIEIYEEAR
jgi:hypothetical protein